jgi:hypothetical protein
MMKNIVEVERVKVKKPVELLQHAYVINSNKHEDVFLFFLYRGFSKERFHNFKSLAFCYSR